MFSKKPLNAIGNLLQKWSQFKREMFMSKSKPQIGTTLRRDKCFEGIDFSECVADELLDVNQRFLATVLDDPLTFTVIPIDKTRRIDGKPPPKICGHNRKITNLKWNPFDHHEIASSSADGTIKLWKIPEDGLTKDTSICRLLLLGHKGSISLLEWHVSASDVLLSVGSDMKCMIWNVRIESTFMEITLPGNDVPASVSWCPDGSSFVVLWGDQTMRVVEPRSGNSLVKNKPEGRPGKYKKVIYVDDKRLLTVGSCESSIVLKLWEMDGGNMKLLKEDATNSTNTDNTNTDNSFSSFFDRQQMILYLFQKENGCLKNYKITHNDITSLGNHVTTPHKSIAMMPMCALNLLKNEVRFYKITSHKNICELITVTGNKTIDSGKHPSPRYSADQWFQGQPQSLSPITLTVKKPESSLSSPSVSQSLSSPSSMISSSSFIHLTFSSPKLNRKLTKGVSTESEQCLFKPDLIPRRNSAIGQQHYLYSDVSQSPTPSHFESMKSLPIGENRNASPSYDNFSQPQLIHNKAYKGGNDRRYSEQFNLTPIFPLENGLVQNKVRRASPRTRSHKSPTLSAVRLRRMKQKEMMFHSSSSSSSNEGLDGVGRGDRWSENPLYSQTIHKARKYPARPRSKGRQEGQRKHSLVADRCSIIDFGPLDDALNEVINQNRSISRSTCDLSQVSKRNESFNKFQKFQPIIETNVKHIPIENPSNNKTKRITSHVGANSSEVVHKNPIMNGYHNSSHYRSAFSIVKPPTDLPIFGPDVPNPRIFNGSNVIRPVPQMNSMNNFHSTEHLPHRVKKQNDYKFEFVNLKPSSNLLRTVSLKESPTGVGQRGNPLIRSRQPSSSFSIQRMQQFNQSTPHLAASPSIEHFHPLQNLQSSLQTITEDETKFQSVNGCYSSSSSLSTTSEATLHSDNSTINYELNNEYQQMSQDSDLSGPDEISNSFVYESPVSRLKEVLESRDAAHDEIFEKCSRQKDTIDDLKKALTERELQIRKLEKQLKRLSNCSDGLPMST